MKLIDVFSVLHTDALNLASLVGLHGRRRCHTQTLVVSKMRLFFDDADSFKGTVYEPAEALGVVASTKGLPCSCLFCSCSGTAGLAKLNVSCTLSIREVRGAANGVTIDTRLQVAQETVPPGRQGGRRPPTSLK